MKRREFLMTTAAAAAPAILQGAKMTPKDRVNKVLAGQAPDRVPFTFWHHFGDEKEPGAKHAASTLEFQKKFNLDIVKVMSDYAYPKGTGKNWWELQPLDSPFPEQLKSLELIRDGLKGQKHFVETIFNPYNVLQKLAGDDSIMRLMVEKPQALLDALEAVAKSEANHAREAVKRGASGVFLAIANSGELEMLDWEYEKFSAPFDKMVLDAVKDAPMNTLHIHGDRPDMSRFMEGFSAPILNYSAHGSMLGFRRLRERFSGVIMGGLDERGVKGATAEQWKREMEESKFAAPKWICSPGCSVPDDSTDEQLLTISKLFA